MVSVIIPVYNVEKYIGKCLDSIIAQTYKDFEIIIVDDGTKDRSGVICDEYARLDSRIRVFHEINGGVSSARNKGLNYASGDWVLFVDSDDWINEKLLETCCNEISKNENTDVCIFGFKEVEDENVENMMPITSYKTIVAEGKTKLGLQYRIFNRDRDACCDKNVIKLSSPWKMYRKKFLDDNNIRFTEELVNGEDGVFNLYAYQYAKKIVLVETPLYFYRQRRDSVTQKYTKNVERDFSLLHKAYRKFIGSIENAALFEDVLKERLIWSFSFCCILKYCHPDNPHNYRQRKSQFLKVYTQQYHKEVQDVSLENFGMKKKLVFYFIKKKNFMLVSALCALQRYMENLHKK